MARLARRIERKGCKRNDVIHRYHHLGLPKMIVDVVIDSDAIASKGDLDSSSRALSTLIGRLTTPLAAAVQAALAA